MRFIFPESIKWEPTQYWLLLGHIRAQNPSFGLKSGLWGELVISRSSSAHIFRGSLPFMFMGTDISMFFSFYSLFFQLQYHAISFVHTFLCILPCRIFSCELCVIEGFHVWEYPETISCLWSLIKMLIFLFCWFVSFSWLHYAACRFLVPQRGWTLYGPCTLCEGRAESWSLDHQRSPWFR